jgi:hypothetical protein
LRAEAFAPAGQPGRDGTALAMCRAVLRTPLGLLAALVASLPAAGAALEWRLSSAVAGLGEASAVAWDGARGRLAVGDAAGVWLGALDGPGSRVLRRGPVHDLLFVASGALLVATERGLHEIAADGTAREHALAPGAAAKLVRRLTARAELQVAATDDGAFACWGSGPWRRLDAGLPAGPAEAVALREAPGGVELWLVAGGELHRALLPDPGTGPAAASRALRAQPVPGVREAVDLATDAPGAAVLVLSPDRLLAFDGARWRAVDPGLPPGAEVRRIGRAAERWWIATDTGLLEASAWEGPWRRTGPPAGAVAVADVAGDARRVLVAADRGLLVGVVAPPTGAGAPSASPPPDPSGPPPSGGSLAGREEPGVEAVQRAALLYLDLGPGRMRELRRGVDRRAWLPLLELSASKSRGRGRSSNHDEAFTSGAYHDLHDLSHDRDSDREIELRMVWDLGSLAFHPESIDVSKEAREVVELRDEVLDEVVQLYFERRRTLLELSLAPPEGPEQERLRLRADELAAGLDAWTGGWFGRRAPPLAGDLPDLSPRVPPENQP